MDKSDLVFWAFVAVAAPGLALPAVIAWWKRRAVVPVVLLSVAFWPAALVVALRLKRRGSDRV